MNKKRVSITFRIERGIAEAYEYQLSAVGITVSQRIRELVKRDLADLDCQIDEIESQIAALQAQLIKCKAIAEDRKHNPPIPDKKRDLMTSIIEKELEDLSKSREMWGPGDLRKRIDMIALRTGLHKPEILNAFRELAGHDLQDVMKLRYFNEIAEIVQQEGD